MLWDHYYLPASIEKTLEILKEKGNKARVVAGATDLILEIERGVRKGIDTLVDITHISNMDQITFDEEGMKGEYEIVTKDEKWTLSNDGNETYHYNYGIRLVGGTLKPV